MGLAKLPDLIAELLRVVEQDPEARLHRGCFDVPALAVQAGEVEVKRNCALACLQEVREFGECWRVGVRQGNGNESTQRRRTYEVRSIMTEK